MMGLTCKICFENASSQGASRAQPRITPCGHVFCHSCATTWFRSEADCPVCRRRVEGLSSLILLYDQDAGCQSSPFESSDESAIETLADCGIHFGPQMGVENLGRGFHARNPGCTVMDNASAAETARNLEARNIRERDTDSGQKHCRDEVSVDEDVQVRLVLGKVAERWQLAMIERAKLKMQVACLDESKQELLSQLQRLTEENNALREALNSRAWSANRRRSTQVTGADANNHHDGWDPRFVGDAVLTHNSRRLREMDFSPLLHQESCYLGCDTGPVRASPRSSDRILERLQVNNWELVHTFATHSGPVHGIAVNPSGNLVATASWDNVCKVYDVHSEEEISMLSGHEHGLYAVKFSPSKCNVVGTVSSDHTCRLWNAENGECLGVLEGHTDEVNGLAFKNGTHLLATASDDMTGKIWDAEKRVWITDLKGHQHAVYGVCFQPQGHLLATASFDLTVKLWDLRSADSIGTLRGHLEDVIGVDFDTSGNILATGSDDKTCRVWDLRTQNVLKVLNEHGGEVKRVVFSPFSQMLATTCGDTTVRLFETSTFQCCHVLSSHSDHVFDVAWSPTAEFLVTASHDHLWKLWVPKSVPVGYMTGSSKFSRLEDLRITQLDEHKDCSYNL